jgi:hypothetical protein
VPQHTPVNIPNFLGKTPEHVAPLGQRAVRLRDSKGRLTDRQGGNPTVREGVSGEMKDEEQK